ncbi:hypothetical protein Tco_0910055 [Tanacetum coccineum]|uniref:Uncharacterized protein n=1 Tax=Tanacetum coccineum TaxID=301880 RepID=A0ABQ5CRY7_9ASTR
MPKYDEEGIVSEATIRSVLHLAIEGGVECLPTATIFEEIARIGRDTEVSQPSEPNMVADEDVLIERVTKQSNDPLSGEDRLKLKELMILCTNLQTRVLELENTKTSQQIRIGSLERKVKKLEKKYKTRTHKLKRLYKVGLSAREVSSKDEAILGDQ